MKGFNRIVALILCAVCLFLAGCDGEQPAESVGNTGTNATHGNTLPETVPDDHTQGTEQTETGSLPTDPIDTTQPVDTQPEETDPEQTVPGTEDALQDPTVPMVPQPGETEAEELQIDAAGKKRITYTVNISSVRYVTSPAALPEYPEFAGYDEAWFRDHALVLVYETVASGTVAVDISQITVRDGAASVVLSHEVKSGLGTADMTTWVLWAEVEAGLTLSWSVENPAMDSDVTNH